MTPSRTIFLAIAALVIAASAGYVGYLVGVRNAPGPAEKSEEQEKKAVTTVETAPAEQATMDQTVTAYGAIVAAPEEIQTVSVPFECRVGHVVAAPGQGIAPGTELLDIEPSPEARLQLDEARSNHEAAAHDLALVEQRLAMKLATSQELSTAKQALNLAQLRLENVEKRGIASRRVKADKTGLVSQINVKEGQIIAAGGTLIELVAADRIEARLGVEPNVVAEMQPGQVVRVYVVQGTTAHPVEGHVRLITQKVNPASRLVDVFVALPAQPPLKLETYVRAEVVLASRPALAVPRAAVLPEEDGSQALFTIKDDKAVKHTVKTGLEDDRRIEILGDAVKAGEAVIVLGNYEVEDGQAVEVAKPGEKKSENDDGKAEEKD